MSKNESKIVSTLKSFGDDMMVPVISNFDTSNKRLLRHSKVGQFAKRVVKRASFLSNSIRNSHNGNLNSVSNSKCSNNSNSKY